MAVDGADGRCHVGGRMFKQEMSWKFAGRELQQGLNTKEET